MAASASVGYYPPPVAVIRQSDGTVGSNTLAIYGGEHPTIGISAQAAVMTVYIGGAYAKTITIPTQTATGTVV